MLMQRRRDIVFLFLLTFTCLPITFVSGATLPPEEIDALKQIGKTLGKDDWNFSADPCSEERSWLDPLTTRVYENKVTCNCTYQDNTVCHVVSIVLRGQNLQGVLPPELAKLPYLQQIDLKRNYLNGTIPLEWGSIPLEKISLPGNRITGPIPKELWNIATLTYLDLEANKISGESEVLLQGIEKLVSIKRIVISSNAFSGQLPTKLANLTSLEDFRINDNNLTGRIPSFIKNWTELARLEIQGTGLQGPIPSEISSLVNLTNLRISDINGTATPFPKLDNLKSIRTLILRNCNLTGSIPDYIWTMENLKTLDLSFNKLEGHLPPTLSKPKEAVFIYLTSNLLNGPVPEELKKVTNADLSYNNFTPASTKNCQDDNINLFGSPPTANNLSGAVPPCLKDFDCPKSLLSKFYINCGGEEVTVPVNGTHRATTFTEDKDSRGPAVYIQSRKLWAFSSTGNFLDNDQDQDLYIGKNISRLTMPDSLLYTTARLSPLSLTYYGFCLYNGSYTVKLHFAEIMFSDNKSYSSLGKRIFDIYIQGKLVWKDFNIVAEARGTHKAVVKNFTANVTTNTLEIRFYWAGKGTESLPSRGTYGPLISAISVESESDFTPPGGGNKISAGAVIGIVASVFCVIFLIIGILWCKGCFRKKSTMYEDLKRLDLQTGSFVYRPLVNKSPIYAVDGSGGTQSLEGVKYGAGMIQSFATIVIVAPIVKTNNQYAEIGSLPYESRQFTYAEVHSLTNNFQRCIGKGGFGTVYHGQMTNGTQVAVKMLSPGSIKSPCQGSKEFQNEAHLLMRVHHRNLVPFIGYCQEDGNMALIYEYMTQGHLGTHLSDSNSDALSWDRRLRIALDVAQGLEYLHNGCKPPIIHRDVKTANILLNERLEAKIGDFGLSKVLSGDFTHVSTAVKGTFGYLDPEYCNSNNLTEKSDVYSFGVVLLQLITGKKAIVQISGSAARSLIDWAIPMVVGGDIMDVIDPKLEGNYDIKSIQKVAEIALACTSPKSIDRPHMRDVVVELKEYIGNEKALESESAPENGGCMDSGPGLPTSEIFSYLSAR